MRLAKRALSWGRFKRAFKEFTWGGEWACSLPVRVKHNLSWFFLDGLFAAAGDSIVVTYLTLYLLAVGSSREQIGLLSSFSNLASALMLLPGAMLVERIGHRKELAVLSGGLLARGMVLGLALLPLVLGGSALVWLAMALAVLREAGINLAFPAWISLTGEMVPMEGRGRYFGGRNFVCGIAGMAITLLSGELITCMGAPQGYQIALFAAFVIGSGATYSFWRLKDPRDGQPVRAETKMSLKAALKDIWAHPTFVAFCLIMGLWNFSINIAGPFFNVRMAQDLKFTATMVALTGISSSIASLLVQRKMGEIVDRMGPRRVQALCMLLIPLLPAAWVFITEFWQVALLNVFTGAVWGAFGLVSFNLLLSLTPDAQRARYSAVYQFLVTGSLAAGAATGAWVIGVWGYPGVFWGSAAGRMIAALLFLLFVPAAERTHRLPA